MRWTVGRRIALGYAVMLVLLLAVASVGVYTLSRTAETLNRVLHEQERSIEAALAARGNSDRAVVSFLRYVRTGEERFLREREDRFAATVRQAAELRQTSVTAEMKAGWDEMLRLLRAWDEGARAAIAAKAAGREAEVPQILRERVFAVQDQQLPLVRRLVDSERMRAKEVAQSALAASARASQAMLVISGLAIAAGAAIVWGLARSVLGSLRDTIGTLASASAEILAATAQQAAGTAEEATAVQETSTTVDEVKQTAQLAAQKARAMTEAAQKTALVSQDGRRAVEESVKGMQETRARMETIAERILALSEQGQAIGEIMTSVNDLAEQSNLLAVNAAIEAAKAGEAGKGFAVVAAEVKSLAEQSKQATAQVRGILNDVQRVTQAAVMAAEQGVKTSEAGEAIARQAGEAIRLLADSLTEAAQAAQQILVSSQQQTAGVEQVAVAMHNIQHASTQNMTSTRQVERAAQDLNELAQRLKTLVVASGNRHRAT